MSHIDALENHEHSTRNRRRRRSPFFIFGCILWLVCLVAMACAWYEWRQRRLVAIDESASAADDDHNGRAQKQIKLVPQKDGSFALQEVKEGEEESPWEPEGIDDFSFTNIDGKTITKQDLLGKPFIIGFIFTECRGPCPMVTMMMKELQDRLRKYDFNIVTLTVDPKRDDQETLRKYGENYGANFSRWKFLTGDQAEIYNLIQRSFKMPVEEAKGAEPGFEIIHSVNIMLVDATGQVVGKYDARKVDEVAKCRNDVIRLIKYKTLKKHGNADIDEDDERTLPAWAAALPAVNASLNGLAGVLLVIGFVLIKRKLRAVHAYTMISAFVTSILFLACYLIYHYALHAYTGEPGKRFGHQGTMIGSTYLLILLTHVVLAAAVPFLASITLYRAWRQDWLRHRSIARITFPIWVYVSVTGVIIYVMLYHWPGAAV